MVVAGTFTRWRFILSVRFIYNRYDKKKNRLKVSPGACIQFQTSTPPTGRFFSGFFTRYQAICSRRRKLFVGKFSILGRLGAVAVIQPPVLSRCVMMMRDVTCRVQKRRVLDPCDWNPMTLFCRWPAIGFVYSNAIILQAHVSYRMGAAHNSNRLDYAYYWKNIGRVKLLDSIAY